MDFAVKRDKAAEDAALFQAEAEKARGRIERLKAERKELKVSGSLQILDIAEELMELSGVVREAENRAGAILDTVYDLKAVNPNSSSTADSRSLSQLLTTIASEGDKISSALDELSA